MGREVRRVPLDFEWPMNERWKGYLTPDSLDEIPCKACEGRGFSPLARQLQERWYGNVPFDPSETGSTPYTPANTPKIMAMAERNVAHSPQYYGTGLMAEIREAWRLCNLFNSQWSHHLSQEDVEALVAREGVYLRDLTHTWIKGEGWVPKDPMPVITAAEVNLWTLDPMNSGLSYAVIQAACERQGESDECSACDGHGSHEAYPGQRADSEAWEPEQPPTGPGYQLWETVSEGSPVSPVFARPDDLADWIIDSGKSLHGSNTPRDKLIAWIAAEGSSMGSMVMIPGRGVIGGVEAAAGAL